MAARSRNGLNLRTLDPTVHYFCEQGVASTTRKTYQSALCRFAGFYSSYNVLTPFPVSESLLCYYASYLATNKLSPRQLLAALRLVQAGIQRTHATKASTKVRHPITPTTLLSLKEHWSPQQTNRDIVMIWAAATLCFFGFFRSGGITMSTEKAFDGTKYLAWGDVAVDNTEDP